MQLFNTIILASGLASMVSAAAFGPPGGGNYPPPPGKPTSTTGKTSSSYSSHSSMSTGPSSTSTPYGCAASTVSVTSTKVNNSTVTLPAITLTATSYVTQNASTILVTVTATPSPTAVCITSSQANYLINGFASLLTSYSDENAVLYLSSDFSDYSDSINFLAGYDLGAATFNSLSAFQTGQGQEPAIGFEVDTFAPITIGCTSVAFRWTASLGATPVKGINLFQAAYTGDGSQDSDWQILTNFSEFDSGAWELDIGNSCAQYSASSPPVVAS